MLRNWQKWTDFFHIKVVMNRRIRNENSRSVSRSGKKGPDPSGFGLATLVGIEENFNSQFLELYRWPVLGPRFSVPIWVGDFVPDTHGSPVNFVFWTSIELCGSDKTLCGNFLFCLVQFKQILRSLDRDTDQQLMFTSEDDFLDKNHMVCGEVAGSGRGNHALVGQCFRSGFGSTFEVLISFQIQVVKCLQG